MPEKVEAFTFGDPVPVLDRREILDYLECWRNGRWYEPPINFGGLSKTPGQPAPQFGYLLRPISWPPLLPHRAFGRDTRLKMAIDFLTFGNTYAERLDSMTGKLIMMKHALAKYTRRGVEPGSSFCPAPARSMNSAPARCAS